MTINWQNEVAKREEELLTDLVELLKVKSEREDDKATADAPFGPGPKNALLHMLEYGKRDGFTVKNVDNYAGHIEYGEGDETLGIFVHVDVVPAGDGWDSNPYEPVIKDGKLYARGTSDDKGPGVACYYGLKIIKELGLPISKKVRFIVGTDEESGWADMDYYFEHEEKPDFGFSPDAEFPIINGEKGNVTYRLNLAGTNEGTYKLVNFKAGLRDNMVPGNVKATVIAPSNEAAEQMQADFQKFLADNPVAGNVVVQNGTEVIFDLTGKSAHGASPQEGINAGSYLATFLNNFDFAGAAKQFLEVAAKYIHLDFYGKNLGVAKDDPRMGKLTMNAGLFDFEEGKENFIGVNFRFPQGMTDASLLNGLQDVLGAYGVKVTQQPHSMVPHYVPIDDPMVAALLQTYTDHTGLPGKEQVIGGGTFGRLLERGVAYGAQFPGWTDTMHQANEFMKLDDIYRSAVIYADAIYRLIK